MKQAGAKPRILHIQKITGIYGSESHLAMLLPGLVERGFSVDFLILLPPDLDFPDYVESLRGKGVNVDTLPIRGHADPGAFSAMRKTVAAGRYELVHTHLIHGDLYGIPVARLCRVPHVISTKHGYDDYESTSKLYRLNGLACRGAELVITISDALQDYVARVEGIPKNKMTTVYYGIDTDRLLASAEAALFDRAAEGVPDDALLLTTVGRLVPVKGHEFLFRAMQTVTKECPNARLLVVGDGPLRSELEKLAAELGVSEHIIFPGFRRDVPSILRASDLAVYPSLGEGFGLGVVESLLQETPVVATRVMAIPELVEHGRTGILTPPSDARALADAMLELIAHPDRRHEMGREGKRRVLSGFTVETMITRTEEIYRSVLGAS